MFNNIIYFIIVLLIFHIDIDYPHASPETSLSYTFGMIFLGLLAFSAYCQWSFRRLLDRVKADGKGGGHLTGEYQRLVVRASILAIFFFAVDIHIFSLKPWLWAVPGVEALSVLEGALGISLFFVYLCVIWNFSHAAYEALFRAGLSRKSFVLSHFRLNAPILFPWLFLMTSFDLLALTPLGAPDGLLNSPVGQFIFFALFLSVLMIFLPELIRYWWGCRPFGPSERIRELKGFLQEEGLKYRDILRWPIFEGRMMTAGIMGIVPRYRYILITDTLLEILSQKELKAVTAHEMGHAKHRHLLYYIIFILGYMVVSFGLYDFSFYLFSVQPFFLELITRTEAESVNLFQLIVSFPVLISIFVYFRYVIGFFMRNFERQADLYSAVIMESPNPTIRSLEKIALLSGKSRAIPSWHHFSIKERVDYLLRFLKEPGLVKRHSRLVGASFVFYLVCIVFLGYLLNFSPVKQHFNEAKQDFSYALMNRMQEQWFAEEPDNTALRESLAMAYHEMGKFGDAIETYERVIALDPSRAAALNNLAWILVTAPEEGLRDRKRALVLAKEAVKLERSSIFLDTLAEAYYENGSIPEAIDIIKEAISMATENRDYYEEQLKKFETSQPPRHEGTKGGMSL